MTVSLTGILASRTTNDPPAFLGKRFDAEGQPLPCSGNTIIGHLRGFDPQTDPVFSMCVQALEAHASGLWARVAPVSDSENARLRGLRDRLARHVGLDHRPGHADYAFHVTLAYAIDWPSPEAAAATDILIAQADAALKSALPVFDVGPPEVCLFDDICEFRTQFTL